MKRTRDKKNPLTIRTLYRAGDPKHIISAEDLLESDSVTGLTAERIGEMFDLRDQIARRKERCNCACCNSPLRIMGNSSRRLFFQHIHQNITPLPYEDCIYYSGYEATPEEIKRGKYQGKQEGSLHKRLKELVANLLGELGTVKTEEIIRDKKNKHIWRRPDIRWENGQHIVAIEIQVSTASINCILGRDDFYSRQNMYILWIVREYNMSFTTNDIFTEGQHNLFILDEEAEKESRRNKQLWLKCYHYGYNSHLQKEPELVYDWVTVDMLSYDTNARVVYYKTDEQLREEARAKMEAEQDEEDDKKYRWLKQIDQYLDGEDLDVYEIASQYDNDFRDYRFLHEHMRRQWHNTERIPKHFDRYMNLLDRLDEYGKMGLGDALPTSIYGEIELRPVLYQADLPQKDVCRLLQYQPYNGNLIQQIGEFIQGEIQKKKANKNIIKQCYYYEYYLRIIWKSDGECDLVPLLDRWFDLILVVQSLLIGICLPYDQNLTGMANAVKQKKDYMPYFHLILKACNFTQEQHVMTDEKLQKQMAEIRLKSGAVEQKDDLNGLFRFLFPGIYF